jgi:NADH:ubiquinone oxidoreductase subunit E
MPDKIKDIIDRRDGKKSSLIMVLQDIQKEYRYLSECSNFL